MMGRRKTQVAAALYPHYEVHLFEVLTDLHFCGVPACCRALNKICMKRRTSQEWFELIENWKTSGLTQKKYCTHHSIAYSCFHLWCKKFREEKSLPVSGAAFIPVKVATKRSQNKCTAPIELLIPDGRRVNFHEGIEVEFLRALLS